MSAAQRAIQNHTAATRPVAGAGDWVALTLPLPLSVAKPLIALGAESKGVFCLAVDRTAYLSRDFGVLYQPDNYRCYRSAVEAVIRDGGHSVAAVACDMHPNYLSTALAIETGLPRYDVQHHHAHIAACLADNEVAEEVIGLCCDGAGCGSDKASWGCEILVVSPAAFTRAAHLQYFCLPGSDAAAMECWRPALSLAQQAYGRKLPAHVAALFADVPTRDRTIAERLLARGLQCPATSSLGRLFDGLAYLLGICCRNTHEAEAACKLQAAAEQSSGEPLNVDLVATDGVLQLDFAPVVRNLLERRQRGEAVERLAADFHETVAKMLADAAALEAEQRRLRKVAMSGGCLMNRLLADRLRARLTAARLEVLEHRRTPCTDAGLPLGQALVAAARMMED